ncbi:fibronectin type III domain-containing protein [Halobacillus sp. B29]|uniref:fibronectin type III domain-containing protein n=1 Tax=Halobacillus sp. B29 TaxID=3457432 RepID=UPI003FCDD82A
MEENPNERNDLTRPNTGSSDNKILITNECSDISSLDWIEGSEPVEIEDNQPPIEVSNIYASNVSKNSLILNWTASPSSDLKQYNVYEKGNFLGYTSKTSFYVSSLNAGLTYTFTIKSVDDSNNESVGESLTVTTLPLEYYLKMSGVDSYFVAPSSLPTYNKVVFEGLISEKNNADTFYKGRTGYSIMSGAKRNITKIEVNDVELNGNLGNVVPIGEDNKITHFLTELDSGRFTLFGENSSNSIPGYIYRIAVYFNDLLIAYYDTSNGNVLDQSGNGHHASINGSHDYVEID